MTDLDILKTSVALCQGIYDYIGDPPPAWSYHHPGVGTDGVCVGGIEIDDSYFVVFRGTADFDEWIDDFDFVAHPQTDPKLGEVHAGFLVGMPEAWELLKAAAIPPGRKLVFTGHSLGAARADVACAMAILDGIMPDARVVAGEPFPGFQSLCDPIKAIRFQASLCNGDAQGHDLITNVPFPKRPFWPYTRPTPLLHVSESPSPGDSWDAFRYHHIQLYNTASKGLTALPQPL